MSFTAKSEALKPAKKEALEAMHEEVRGQHGRTVVWRAGYGKTTVRALIAVLLLQSH
jgi:hypothetical protein